MGWYQKILFLLSFISPVYLFFLCQNVQESSEPSWKSVHDRFERCTCLMWSPLWAPRVFSVCRAAAAMPFGCLTPGEKKNYNNPSEVTDKYDLGQVVKSWVHFQAACYSSYSFFVKPTLFALCALVQGVHLPAVTYYVLYIFTFIVGMGCKAPVLLYSIRAL